MLRKLALGKYEIQSKCKYRWARIPEGRAREKGNTGNNGKVESLERVVSDFSNVVPRVNFSRSILFLFFVFFFFFCLTIDRTTSVRWFRTEILSVEINKNKSSRWVSEKEVILDLFLFPPVFFSRTFPRKWENGVDGRGWILRGSSDKALKFHWRRITGPFYRGE